MSRTIDERREALARDVELAETLRSLSQHPAVVSWFAQEEKTLTESAIDLSVDEKSRVMAIARVHALRSLRTHLMAIEAAVVPALKRLDGLRQQDQDNAHA